MALKLDIHLIKALKAKKYKKQNLNKEVYPYSGLQVFMRRSTENGKTISAVKLLKERLNEYPMAKFITNVKIKGINNITYYFKDTDELVELLKNEIDIKERIGYVIFIDEIHIVLAELFGKSSPIFLQFLSQQRKLSINIIGTSQMYNKLPRVIRDYLRQSRSDYNM